MFDWFLILIVDCYPHILYKLFEMMSFCAILQRLVRYGCDKNSHTANSKHRNIRFMQEHLVLSC